MGPVICESVFHFTTLSNISAYATSNDKAIKGKGFPLQA
jgi:hypothetical protein